MLNQKKKSKKTKKISDNCVYFKNQYKYGDGNGFPCKGSKGEKEYKKYLDAMVNEWQEKKKKPFVKKKKLTMSRLPTTPKEHIKHCNRIIKMYTKNRKKKLKELDNFYKTQAFQTKKKSKKTKKTKKKQKNKKNNLK